jgi:hypothetical protein
MFATLLPQVTAKTSNVSRERPDVSGACLDPSAGWHGRDWERVSHVFIIDLIFVL